MQIPHLLLAALISLTLIGCGKDSPDRYEVDGQVTYNGAPVPYGSIIFEPDDSQGNSGPGTRGTIEKGSYKLSVAEGVISGPLRVRISGYDGIAPKGGGLNVHGKELFPQYATTVDQPTDTATHNFDIKGK